VNIIGISAFFHDSACCLLQDGVLVAAAEEERFSRRKHDSDLPTSAFRYCLKEGHIDLTDVDCIAFYEQPRKKLARQLWMALPASPLNNPFVLHQLDPGRAFREIRDHLKYEGPIEFVDHHLSHAASSCLFSGFSETAVLTVDGVGEWATTTYGSAIGPEIRVFEEVEFPNSLGLLYSAITTYLGFAANDGEYKVMGLAPYGQPLYVDKFEKVIHSRSNGGFELELRYFDFVRPDRMYTDDLPELFGAVPREPGAEIKQFHKDLARSLQFVLETILLEKAAYLHSRTGMANLCMAGGVALNCVANARIRKESPFRKLFIPPVPGDSGGAIGAAAIASIRNSKEDLHFPDLNNAFWGPAFPSADVMSVFKANGICAADFRERESELLHATAERLQAGQIIGWFQGRMEYGPRALGARSILADPRRPDMRDRINGLVKKRESFRPFAPSVLEECASAHFKLDSPSPFMLQTCQVCSTLELPAITHVDGSARVQTVTEQSHPRFARLLREFEHLTGCPILLNTSFNMKDEPIVCTPFDALLCFIRAQLDALVIEDFIVERSAIQSPWVRRLVENLYRKTQVSNVPDGVYTLL
jgi:carbamoyltransferase